MARLVGSTGSINSFGGNAPRGAWLRPVMATLSRGANINSVEYDITPSQMQFLKRYLVDAELMRPDGVPTNFCRVVSDMGWESPVAQTMILTNLAYNNPQINWYLRNMDAREGFTRDSLTQRLADSVGAEKAEDYGSVFFNAFKRLAEDTPMGARRVDENSRVVNSAWMFNVSDDGTEVVRDNPVLVDHSFQRQDLMNDVKDAAMLYTALRYSKAVYEASNDDEFRGARSFDFDWLDLPSVETDVSRPLTPGRIWGMGNEQFFGHLAERFPNYIDAVVDNDGAVSFESSGVRITGTPENALYQVGHVTRERDRKDGGITRQALARQLAVRSGKTQVEPGWEETPNPLLEPVVVTMADVGLEPVKQPETPVLAGQTASVTPISQGVTVESEGVGEQLSLFDVLESGGGISEELTEAMAVEYIQEEQQISDIISEPVKKPLTEGVVYGTGIGENKNRDAANVLSEGLAVSSGGGRPESGRLSVASDAAAVHTVAGVRPREVRGVDRERVAVASDGVRGAEVGETSRSFDGHGDVRPRSDGSSVQSDEAVSRSGRGAGDNGAESSQGVDRGGGIGEGLGRGDAGDGERPEAVLLHGEKDREVNKGAGRGLEVGGIDYSSRVDSWGNYSVKPEDNIGGTASVRFENNLAAIETLKRVEGEYRKATPQEQSVLVKYTGWGGLSAYFKEDNANYGRLKDALTDSEYRQAKASVINAHYTDPVVVSAVWGGVVRMGFNGGSVLEPATGTGLFLGGRPANMPLHMHGVEIDSVSGRMARLLYPSADIKLSGYEDIKMPESNYNLVISNVPFSTVRPVESRAAETPGIPSGRFPLHDFYLLKNLHGVKEGGLVACISTHYTMDKENSEVRERLAADADFLGAIRLPNSAFNHIADTEVVADIIYLQKRDPHKSMSELTKRFIGTSSMELENREGERHGVMVNNYFIDHPEMVLGTPTLTGSMYGDNEYNVEPTGDLEKQLVGAVNNLPRDVMSLAVDAKVAELSSYGMGYDTSDVKNGSFFITSQGELKQKDAEIGIDLEIEKKGGYTSEEIRKIKQMVEIKNCVLDMFNKYYDGEMTGYRENLSKLNELYDSFHSEYGKKDDRKGRLNHASNKSLFAADPMAHVLLGLESEVENRLGTSESAKGSRRRRLNPDYEKADIFNGLNFVVKQKATTADTVVEALALSMVTYSSINLSYMSSLLQVEGNQLLKELVEKGHVYKDPEAFLQDMERYIPADEYLSGNVRKKLEFANQAMERDASFLRNVDGLESVKPKDLTPEDIYISMNSAPIIKPVYIRDFIEEKSPGAVKWNNPIEVEYEPYNGSWSVDYSSYNDFFEVAANDKDPVTGNVERRQLSGRKVLEILLNDKSLERSQRVAEKDMNGFEKSRFFYLPNLSAALKNKAEEVKHEWEKFVWSDSSRTKEICDKYNNMFRSTVVRNFTHPDRVIDPNAKVHLFGCSFPAPLRPHQADAVYQCLQEKNVLLAHAVGAGKTLEMVCAGMELKRLGLTSKPVYVVPKNLVEPWERTFRTAYPMANILVANKSNFGGKKSETFVNRIAMNDWDAVIMSKNAFESLKLSPERMYSFYTKTIQELDRAIDAADKANGRGGGKSLSVRAKEELKKRLETKLKGLMKDVEKGKYDSVLPFEQLGITHLFVDEADAYKNLWYHTSLNAKGLNPQAGSSLAFDMLMKTNVMHEQGGGVVFATGTPIRNSVVETHPLMRYLQPDMLQEKEIEAFDAFRRMFFEVVHSAEMNNTATGYKGVDRLSKVVNVDDLLNLTGSTWSVMTAARLEEMRILYPNTLDENGKVIANSGNLPFKTVINYTCPALPLIESYQDYLVEREKKLKNRGRKAEKGDDNALTIIGDGLKSATDMRLINEFMPDDVNSKLNVTARLLKDLYDKYDNEGYATAVFWDKPASHELMVHANDKGRLVETNVLKFDGIETLKEKLVALGIPPEHIADVRGTEWDERQDIYEGVDRGRVRIVFGGTESMGTGVNMQTNLKALINMDAPWTPRDIEQRVGRGYRAGNTTQELLVFNVLTEGTLEAGVYKLMDTKAQFIWKIMNRDVSCREMEEDFFSNASIAAIKNPLLKESLELSQDVKTLERQSKVFNDDVAAARRDLQDLPKKLERQDELIKKLREDIAQREPEESNKGEKFHIVLDGKVFDNSDGLTRRAAGEKIANMIFNLYRDARDNHGGIKIEKNIGSYAGFDLKLSSEGSLSAIRLGYLAAVSKSGREYSIEVKHDSDPIRGIIMGLHSKVYSIKSTLDIAEINRDRLAGSVDNLTKRAEGTFSHMQELMDKKERLAVVQREMKNFEKSPEEKAQLAFPWEHLDKRSDVKKFGEDEIREAVDNFYRRQPQLEVYNYDWEKDVHGISDIEYDLSLREDIGVVDVNKLDVETKIEDAEVSERLDLIAAVAESETETTPEPQYDVRNVVTSTDNKDVEAVQKDVNLEGGKAASDPRRDEFLSLMDNFGDIPAELNTLLKDYDLRDIDLSGVVLRNVDLSNLDLTGANLKNAVLYDAVLSGAVLKNADLTGAELACVQAYDTDFSGAVCRDCDMSYAVLHGAKLETADLTGTILRGAELPEGFVVNSAAIDTRPDSPAYDIPVGLKPVEAEKLMNAEKPVENTEKEVKEEEKPVEKEVKATESVDVSDNAFVANDDVLVTWKTAENAKPISAELRELLSDKSRVAEYREAILVHGTTGYDFSGIDFGKADLSNMNLVGVKMTDVKLSGSNLSDCILNYVDLSRADLTGANLQNTVITNTRFNDASMGKVNLQNIQILDQGVDSWVTFTGAVLQKANFTGAELDGVDFSSSAKGKCDFSEAIINQATFKNCNFDGTDLSKLSMKFEDIGGYQKPAVTGVTVLDSSFKDANLSNREFANSFFERCDMSGANMNKFRLINESGMIHSNFDNVNMSDSLLRNVDVAKCSFKGANLSDTSFMAVTFDNSSLNKANLSVCHFCDDTIFDTVNLQNANLSYSNFERIKIENSTVAGVIFDGGKFDNCEFKKVSNVKEASFIDAVMSDTKFIYGDYPSGICGGFGDYGDVKFNTPALPYYIGFNETNLNGFHNPNNLVVIDRNQQKIFELKTSKFGDNFSVSDITEKAQQAFNGGGYEEGGKRHRLHDYYSYMTDVNNGIQCTSFKSDFIASTDDKEKFGRVFNDLVYCHPDVVKSSVIHGRYDNDSSYRLKPESDAVRLSPILTPPEAVKTPELKPEPAQKQEEPVKPKTSEKDNFIKSHFVMTGVDIGGKPQSVSFTPPKPQAKPEAAAPTPPPSVKDDFIKSHIVMTGVDLGGKPQNDPKLLVQPKPPQQAAPRANAPTSPSSQPTPQPAQRTAEPLRPVVANNNNSVNVVSLPQVVLVQDKGRSVNFHVVAPPVYSQADFKAAYQKTAGLCDQAGIEINKAGIEKFANNNEAWGAYNKAMVDCRACYSEVKRFADEVKTQGLNGDRREGIGYAQKSMGDILSAKDVRQIHNSFVYFENTQAAARSVINERNASQVKTFDDVAEKIQAVYGIKLKENVVSAIKNVEELGGSPKNVYLAVTDAMENRLKHQSNLNILSNNNYEYIKMAGKNTDYQNLHKQVDNGDYAVKKGQDGNLDIYVRQNGADKLLAEGKKDMDVVKAQIRVHAESTELGRAAFASLNQDFAKKNNNNSVVKNGGQQAVKGEGKSSGMSMV